MGNIHEIDWFNFNGDFAIIFKGIKDCHFITANEVGMYVPGEPNPNDLNKATFKNTPAGIIIIKANAYGFAVNATISKFMLLSAIQFKNDNQAAQSFILYDLMGEAIPYIRVGVDYFKIIHKDTRYGGRHTQIKHWTKEEIKSDHSKAFLQKIPKYDDFTLVPDNKNYKAVIKNCYNLYSEFAHIPFEGEVSESDIPVTISFLQHIFQEHYELGLKYFKVLYEHPTQILPILCQVSAKNETGKTTLINFCEMIFGGNYVLISPDDLTRNFNSSYATKNVIAIEETFVEKQAGVEKLKSLSTGKSINVARKFIEEHPLPFFGHIILNTNKVKDFMKINSEEIRFWIREIPPIPGKKNTLIEKQLFDEIPKFLKYLIDLPQINFDNGSRMVFTADELNTEALFNVKEESRSQLFKEIEIFVETFFNNHPDITQFHASLIDIKEEWFRTNNQISAAYIRKVLQDEAGMRPKSSHSGKCIKYYRFADESNPLAYKTGFPYLFIRQDEPEIDKLPF